MIMYDQLADYENAMQFVIDTSGLSIYNNVVYLDTAVLPLRGELARLETVLVTSTFLAEYPLQGQNFALIAHQFEQRIGPNNDQSHQNASTIMTAIQAMITSRSLAERPGRVIDAGGSY